MWEQNAKMIEEVYGSFVDWEERFYICPDCGEQVYSCDWTDEDLALAICPICEFTEEE